MYTVASFATILLTHALLLLLSLYIGMNPSDGPSHHEREIGFKNHDVATSICGTGSRVCSPAQAVGRYFLFGVTHYSPLDCGSRGALFIRKAARELRTACQRDGLALEEKDDAVHFCQYDVILSMGKRRGGRLDSTSRGPTPVEKLIKAASSKRTIMQGMVIIISKIRLMSLES
jgi:hypothetical protein